MPVLAQSTRGLASILRDAPVTVPALGALALFVAWASDQAGYPMTHWAPGALIVLALVLIAHRSVRLRLSAVPAPVRLALACLVLYTALSYLSILWAAVPGDAWEGANRTLLYLLVFSLFALWPLRGPSAALLLEGWTLAMIALGAFVFLHLDAASSIGGYFKLGRLTYPGGYENACAATWAMVIWPALVLAGSRRVPWGLRGAFAGGIVLLANLALLSQSRGALFATPVMLVALFALFEGRVRRFAVLLPAAAAVGACAPVILRVGDRLKHGGDAPAALHAASAVTFAAAVAVGALVALAAAVESKGTVSDVAQARVRRGIAALALTTLVAIVAGGWVALGDPAARVRHAWNTFTSPHGYRANGGGNRLLSGFGSYRYDFYRVALDEFSAHPMVGIGADNFRQSYLAHAHSDETPHYPHSLELRALAQTGVVGTLLAVVGLGAALLAAARAVRDRAANDHLAPVVAAAALAGFGYWAVHGSFDWFWEFAGLGAPAFALLGIACALSPRRGEQRGARHVPRALPVALAAVATLAAATSLTAPWLSRLALQDAARVWPRAPAQAYGKLDDAAQLNPLDDEPYLVAGSIALRFGDLARADREFARALARTPGDEYATLERGAIASLSGDGPLALRFLTRAVSLYPRDRLARTALAVVRSGRRVSVTELNRLILLEASRLS